MYNYLKGKLTTEGVENKSHTSEILRGLYFDQKVSLRDKYIFILVAGLHKGHRYKLREVGEMYNMSRERARQIHVKVARRTGRLMKWHHRFSKPITFDDFYKALIEG